MRLAKGCTQRLTSHEIGIWGGDTVHLPGRMPCDQGVPLAGSRPGMWDDVRHCQKDRVLMPCLAPWLQLYRQHISPNVQEDDLFPGGGDYQPINKWNQDTSSGAMHLIQVPAGTL